MWIFLQQVIIDFLDRLSIEGKRAKQNEAHRRVKPCLELVMKLAKEKIDKK